jgi:hypothetical protein
MASGTVGVQSTVDVNSSPTTMQNKSANPATWSIIWFVVAVLVVIGFHIKVFGHPVPPAARFP